MEEEIPVSDTYYGAKLMFKVSMRRDESLKPAT
jgi:hypothetical protein